MSKSANNKLIIEFMGHKVDHLQFANIPEHGGNFNTSSVRYDKSWNWLMGVVDKIEETCVEVSNFEVSIIGEVVRISDGEMYDETTDFGGNKLITTLTSVVDFIKWYNENK